MPLTDPDYHSVSSIAFSPTGKPFAEGDTAGLVYKSTWNGSSAAEASLDGGNMEDQPITSVALSPAGTIMGIGDSGGHAYLGTANGENARLPCRSRLVRARQPPRP